MDVWDWDNEEARPDKAKNNMSDPNRTDTPDLQNWKELPAVASNFDHVWEEEIAARLMAKPNASFAQYAGWNFCGYRLA